MTRALVWLAVLALAGTCVLGADMDEKVKGQGQPLPPFNPSDLALAPAFPAAPPVTLSRGSTTSPFDHAGPGAFPPLDPAPFSAMKKKEATPNLKLLLAASRKDPAALAALLSGSGSGADGSTLHKAAAKVVEADPVTKEVDEDDDGCVFSLDGEDYDFSALRLKPGQPEYIAVDTNKMSYKMNICDKSPVSGSDCQRSNGMICQYSSSKNPTLEGVVARWEAVPRPVWSFIDENSRDAGVKLSMVNGDDCSMHGLRKTREAVIFFACNHAAGTMGTITVVETSTCTYTINVPTELACPGEAGLSAGWHFLIIVFLASGVYFGGGMAWNRYRTGTASLPNAAFWADLPLLVADGMRYTKMSLCDGRSGGDEYDSFGNDSKADYDDI